MRLFLLVVKETKAYLGVAPRIFQALVFPNYSFRRLFGPVGV